MGGVGKLRLCGGNFRPRRDQNPSRNPNDPFFWPYTGTGRHGQNGLIGDVLADAGKVVQPMALLNETDNPQIWEWWTYVAYGTARRIFARRLDTESLQLIQPIFEEQQALIMQNHQTKYKSARKNNL